MAQLESDRAQMLLVGALLLAVVIIALAVIANTAIFTGNLASRSPGSSGSDALELRHEIEQNTGDLVANVNVDSYPDYATRETALVDGIETQDEGLGYHSASTGKSVLTSHVSHTSGIRIEDESPGGSEFGSEDSASGGGSADWDVATSVTDARNFRFEVDRSSLSADATDDNWGDQFIVQFRPTSGSSPQWNVHVGEDGSGNALVNVTRGDASSVVPVGECELSSGTATVDVTSGTVDGRPCEPLDDIWFGSDAVSSQYDVRIENGDAAAGNYSLVVDDGATTTTADSSRSSDGPASYAAVYEAVVDYRYNSPTVTYSTEVRVAPGEPDD